MNDERAAPKQPEIIADEDGVRFFFHAPDFAHRSPTVVEVMAALGSINIKHADFELDYVEIDDEGTTIDFANPNSSL